MNRRTIVISACAVLILAGIGIGHLEAQSSSITITTPVNGYVVYPGSSLTIQVTAATTFVGIGSDLWDELPSYPDVTKTSPPFNFTVPIPSGVHPGVYTLQALGRSGTGPLIQSAPVKITVESPSDPVSLNPQPNSVVMIFRGEQNAISIMGKMPDGTLASFNGSSRISCQSTMPGVVQVKAPCTAIAVTSGTGAITVQVGSVSTNVPVTVQQLGLLGDFNGDGQIDTDDINRLTFWRGQSPSPSGDDRDLNHDGKIDALDARVLTTMCTRPRCATQ